MISLFRVEENQRENMASPWLCGFRFKPTDEDLVHFYLQRKLDGQPLPPGLITDCDIYAGNPWEILGNVKNFDGFYYVFTNLKRMSKAKIDRRAGFGTWKGQTTNRFQQFEGKTHWAKKAFIFEVDKKNLKSIGQNNGRWLMVEFSLGDEGFDGKAVLCRIYNKHARDFHKKEQVGVDYSNYEAIVPYVGKKQVSLADDKEGNQHPTKKMKKQKSTADDEEGHQNSKKMKQLEPVDLYGESIGSTSFCPSNFVVEQLPVSSDYSSRFPEDGAAFLADGELNSLLDFPSDYDLTSLLLDMDVGTGTSPEDEVSKFLAENIDDGGFFSSMPPLTMQCNKVNKDDENGNNLSSSMPVQGGFCDRNAVLRDVN